MKLINKEQVSSITVFKETEGVWSYSWGYWQKMLYIPHRKHKWWEVDKETKEGFYENMCIQYRYISKKEIDESNKWFIKDNSVWTFPFIQVFSAGKEIHTEYFKSYENLEQHIKENYNNCKIKYEKH